MIKIVDLPYNTRDKLISLLLRKVDLQHNWVYSSNAV